MKQSIKISLVLLVALFFFQCQKEKDDLLPGSGEDDESILNAAIKDYWTGHFYSLENGGTYYLDMHFPLAKTDTFPVYVTLRANNGDYDDYKGMVRGDSIFIWGGENEYVNRTEKTRYFKGLFSDDNTLSGVYNYMEFGDLEADWNMRKVPADSLFDYLMLVPIDTIYTPVHAVKDMAYDGNNFYLMDWDLNVIRLDAEGNFLDTIPRPFSSYNLSIGWYNDKFVISDGWGLDEYHFYNPNQPNFFPNPATSEEQYGYESIVEYKNKLLYLTNEWIYEMDLSGKVLNKVHQNTDPLVTSRRAITTDGNKLFYVEIKDDIDYWVVLNDAYEEVCRENVGGIDVGHSCFDGKNIWVSDAGGTRIRSIDTSDFSITDNIVPAVQDLDAIVWDGTSFWCEGKVDGGYNMLHKIDATGSVIESMHFPEQWLPAITYSNDVYTIVTRENIFRYKTSELNLLKINYEAFPSTRYPYFNNGEIWSYLRSEKSVVVYDIKEESVTTIENAEFDIWEVGDIAVDDNYLWMQDYAVSAGGTYEYYKCLKKFDKNTGELVKTYRPTRFYDLYVAMFTDGEYLWYVDNPYFNADNAVIYKLKIRE